MFCIDRFDWLYGLAHRIDFILLAFLLGLVAGEFLSIWFRVTRARIKRLRIKRRMRGVA